MERTFRMYVKKWRLWRAFGAVLFVLAVLLPALYAVRADAKPKAPEHARIVQDSGPLPPIDPAAVQATGNPLATGMPLTEPNCLQPPATAAAKAALPADQLAKYGLPPRTAFPSSAAWLNVVSHVKKRSCTMTPVALRFNEHSTTSYNWGGYYSHNAVSQWDQAEVGWDIPNLYNAWEYHNAEIAQWVGLGGVANSLLVQTGTYEYTNFGITNSNEAFIENLGNTPGNPGYDSTYNNLAYAVFGVNIGDAMYAEAFAYNSFYIEDISTGSSYYAGFGAYADPHYGDCVIEDAEGPLFDTSDTYFSACEFELSNQTWSLINNNGYPWYDDTMTQQVLGHWYTCENNSSVDGSGDFHLHYTGAC
jgi:hypothetical protein